MCQVCHIDLTQTVGPMDLCGSIGQGLLKQGHRFDAVIPHPRELPPTSFGDPSRPRPPTFPRLALIPLSRRQVASAGGGDGGGDGGGKNQKLLHVGILDRACRGEDPMQVLKRNLLGNRVFYDTAPKLSTL